MSTTDESETSASPDLAAGPPSESAGSGDAGQTMWLALVTVGTVLALALAVVAVVMAGSDDTTSSGGGEGGGGDAAGDVTVSAVDIAFEPDAWTVTADAESSITVNNDGAADHNWTALEQGTEIAGEDEFDPSTVLVATADLAGGESETITETFAAGSYQVICTIPGHFAAGMVGTLTAA